MNRGWFADVVTEDDADWEQFPNFWQPHLQTYHDCLGVPVFFADQESCERYIRDELLPSGAMHDLELVEVV